MISNVITDKEWITLKEASKLTGRSVQALRLLINRKRIDKVKKMKDNGPGYWTIHRDMIPMISMISIDDKDTSQPMLSDTYQAPYQDTSQHVIIPAEVYERQQKEHDNMVQGLMMYRYKFEELERQLRLLPAPVEVIPSKLTENEQALRDSQEAIRNLEAELQTRRKAMNELEAELLHERQRSWWQRLWKR